LHLIAINFDILDGEPVTVFIILLLILCIIYYIMIKIIKENIITIYNCFGYEKGSEIFHCDLLYLYNKNLVIIHYIITIYTPTVF